VSKSYFFVRKQRCAKEKFSLKNDYLGEIKKKDKAGWEYIEILHD